ncbi:unnamed protein product [Lymnaea stagnalis]|uniref:Uncharacterized protein n=1 Tax=Lymnaea stagnalis TaxID=6523 RepID=A0AAV2HUB5_LYMST
MLGSPVLSLCIGVGMDIMNNGDKKDKRAEVIQTLRTSVVSLGATSVMAVIQCVLVITCHHDVIVISSVMLVIFRTALYSCGTAFLRIMYPSEYFGILCGIMSLLAGGFSFLQYPLFLWIQHRDQAWKEVFGLLGLLGIISLVQPLYLCWKSTTISLREKGF